MVLLFWTCLYNTKIISIRIKIAIPFFHFFWWNHSQHINNHNDCLFSAVIILLLFSCFITIFFVFEITVSLYPSFFLSYALIYYWCNQTINLDTFWFLLRWLVSWSSFLSMETTAKRDTIKLELQNLGGF